MQEVFDFATEKMEKSIKALHNEFVSMRVGRASAAVLDKIMVDYYGSQMPINQLGNISSPEARLLVISPYDAATIKEIEKAIQKSDLGINPSNDGRLIRLVFPELTEERRKELVKLVRKKGEESKVAIRSIRRDAIDSIKKAKKDGDITVLGYELGRAKELLEAEGYSVRCVETRSRKGLNGNEKRVIRQRADGDAVELIWALFKTDCEYGG